ncbi:MAG: hypothetical protein JST75_01540 [Bacteroidetes bacterium]|nr:hypothetical protein [Bacteroidota bacterium]
MKRKKFISIFLILVLSIQLLPLKQMVSWLITNQVTEELVHIHDSGKITGLDEVHKHFAPGQDFFSTHIFNISQGSVHHDAEALIARHADDIPTPPPNC